MRESTVAQTFWPSQRNWSPMRKPCYLVILPLLLLAGCAAKQEVPVVEARRAAIGSFGVDVSLMDASIRPGDDFYGYANGKWLASFEIPADRASFSTGT